MKLRFQEKGWQAESRGNPPPVPMSSTFVPALKDIILAMLNEDKDMSFIKVFNIISGYDVNLRIPILIQVSPDWTNCANWPEEISGKYFLIISAGICRTSYSISK